MAGKTRNHIAAINTTTGLATAWNPNANDRVSAIAVSGSDVYAGGNFTDIGGMMTPYIVSIDAATGMPY